MKFNLEKAIEQDPVDISNAIGECASKLIFKDSKSYVLKNKSGVILMGVSYKHDAKNDHVIITRMYFSDKCRESTKKNCLYYLVDFISMFYEYPIEYHIDERNLSLQLILRDIGFIAKEFMGGGYIMNGKYCMSFVKSVDNN